MKRLRFFLPLICLLLCACGRNELLHRDRMPEWPFTMTTSLILQLEETDFTADWTYRDSQSTFILQTPSELSGVTIVCNAVECRIESGGVQADMPQQSAFVLLDRAYRALADGLVEPQSTQEGWLYDGIDRYGFEALADVDGGLHIRFPKQNAEAVFKVIPTETIVE